MGFDKVLLPVNGVPLVSIVHTRLSGLFDTVLVVGHHRPEFDALGITAHPDLMPDRGILGGIYTALSLAETPYTFAAACDMPNIDLDLVEEVLSHREEADAVIPRGPKGFEPLFAVYSRACLPAVRKSLEAGELKVMTALEGLNVVTPRLQTAATGPDPLANLNTPEDLEKLGDG